MCNVVGIDVAKNKSVVSILESSGTVVAPAFDVAHTGSALQKLADQISSLPDDSYVVLEIAGRYSDTVAQFLHSAGLFVYVVPPKRIKDYCLAQEWEVSSHAIAAYGLAHLKDLQAYTPVDALRSTLKLLNRQRSLYIKTRIMLKNNLTSLLDLTYPGVSNLFTSSVREDGTQKWLDYALYFSHVEDVRSKSLEEFSRAYSAFCEQNSYRYSSKKAAKLYAYAQDCVAVVPKNPNVEFAIRQAITSLIIVSRSLEDIKAKMAELASQLPEYAIVMGMAGVGESLGPQLIAEVGDISRFSSKRALAAYAGVCAGSKRANSAELRKTVFLVMTSILKAAPAGDAVFKFMDKKRSEGKPYMVYMMAAANKFLHIYYSRVSTYCARLKS